MTLLELVTNDLPWGTERDYHICEAAKYCQLSNRLARTFDRMVGKVDMRVGIVGAPGSGKGTIARKLGLGKLNLNKPISNFEVQTVMHMNINVSVFSDWRQVREGTVSADVQTVMARTHAMDKWRTQSPNAPTFNTQLVKSMSAKWRNGPLARWLRNFYARAPALVYVVDSSETTEAYWVAAKTELHRILQGDQLEKCDLAAHRHTQTRLCLSTHTTRTLALTLALFLNSRGHPRAKDCLARAGE